MIEAIEKIQELKLEKSSWKLTKLGDLAEDISKRVDNPSASAYDRFVGLEHFVSGDIKIKNWGTTENLASSAKAFQAGDILFARRNAYLRRASIVDFDGCCSGDAFVIRENHNKVIPGFLAFLMNSDALWDYANSNAAGTMSKRVKWRDLAEYEFLLPPKEEQAKLAELLWAMDEVIEREKGVGLKLSISRDAYFENLTLEMKGKKVKLSKILIPKNEKSQVPHKRDKYIGLEHIDPGEYYSNKFDNTNEVKAQCNIVNEGDLCYSKLRPYLDKAIIAKFNAISSTELLVYDTKMVSKEYVLYHIHSRPFLNYITGQCFGTKMPRVSHKIIGDFDILVPNDESLIISKMDEFLKNSEMIKVKIEASKSLQKSLINQVF
jgi:type I restriction enzyme S subunit